MPMRNFFAILLTVAAFGSNAQNQKPAQPQTPSQVKPQEQSQRQVNPFVDHFFKKYTLATRWNDFAAAKDALFDLIVETGNDSLAYTLAVYYYDNNQFAPCVFVCKDLLARAPKNTDLLQMSGSAFEGLGLKEKALPNYETLYLVTNNLAVLYKMATLQYDTKLFAECQANVDILLSKPTEIDKLKVTVNNDQNKSKEYPLKVALLNLKGLLAHQAGDKALAKKSFEDALALAPDFQLAKENLSKMK
jgi:tetratricopeptide (TPR) repeat protein